MPDEQRTRCESCAALLARDNHGRAVLTVPPWTDRSHGETGLTRHTRSQWCA